jgi:DNA-binding winged helix-turn-helix (wHTH) protein
MSRSGDQNPKSKDFYQFGPFLLDRSRCCLLCDGEIVPLRPKLFELLLFFVESGGRLLTKEELMRAVWRGTNVAEPTVARSVLLLRQTLGDRENGDQYIETVKARGYRFVATVTLIPNPTGDTREPSPVSLPTQTASTSASASDDRAALLGGHFWHVLGACTLYGALYAVALLLEIAYRWEEYGANALRYALLIFSFISVASIGGMWLDWKVTSRGSRVGMALAGVIFLLSALLVYLVLCRFLPTVEITKATFQTYTAQGAYLKDTLYFLILAGFFLVAPFHFVVYLEREWKMGRHSLVLETLTRTRQNIAPKGTLYVGALGALLLIFLIRTSFDHVHLLDNLAPAPRKNLFIQLVYVRVSLYFAVAVECLIWYYRSLDRIKGRSVG